MKTFDALVIGAGPAGSTAAALLARAGWSVALAEQASFPRDKVCGGFISAATRPVLEQLGITREFEAMAGPEVRRVALFTSKSQFAAAIPAPGRAIRRSSFDALLLDRAARYGVRVYQPRKVSSVEEIPARTVIAAHGSWLPGRLLTQIRHGTSRASDLFGFKAQFRDSALPGDLMPLICFPGGYGGLVACAKGLVTLSFCVRRDALRACRRRFPDSSAGDAVFAHVGASCEPLRAAMTRASRQGPWLAAGPIRPGLRALHRGNGFLVGNAAAEAHPAIAEGIGMAMQSAALLSNALLHLGPHEAAIEYGRRWRRHFNVRMRASRLIAHAAMSPRAVRLMEDALRFAPGLLPYCASLSGKGFAWQETL
jgi:menaquinone-9 beta-reductase